MPELPEVERERKRAGSALLGREITHVFARDDRIVFDGVTPATVRRNVTGRTVEAVRRKGKQLWIELDRPPHLLIHLGMTGSLALRDPDDGRPDDYCKLELRPAGAGPAVGFLNNRRLGRVRLRDDPEHQPPISELGFDPLNGMPGRREFRELLGPRRGVIKVVLLDQRFAAGVGNWIADEVLYQAGIDPRRPAEDLTDDEIERLRRRLRDIVRRAVGWDADYRRFPRTWLFHRRWRLRESRNGEVCDVDGRPLTFDKVAGRTTAWVPAAQS